MPYTQKLQFRPVLDDNKNVRALYSRPICLHFDAWFWYCKHHDTFFTQTIVSRAGKRVIDEAWRQIARNPNTGDLALITPNVPTSRELSAVHINTKPWAHMYVELNLLHWRELFPWSQQALPVGYKYRSILFHYIRVLELWPWGDGMVAM